MLKPAIWLFLKYSSLFFWFITIFAVSKERIYASDIAKIVDYYSYFQVMVLRSAVTVNSVSPFSSPNQISQAPSLILSITARRVLRSTPVKALERSVTDLPSCLIRLLFDLTFCCGCKSIKYNQKYKTENCQKKTKNGQETRICLVLSVL